MAISTSSNFTLPTANTNPSVKLPTTLSSVVFPRRLSKAISPAITAALSTSTSKRRHHLNILEKLHLKPASSTSSSSGGDVQTLSVYEINEGDRRSPAFLKLSKLPEKSLGDIVTFSNKLYSGDLTARLGVTAGMIMYIEKDAEGGDRYEAVYSFHFGKFGHVSVQGAYYSDMDSELAVTGGTGVFEGVRGKVKLTNVAYPFKLFYTFELKGVERLPKELVGGVAVEPSPEVKPLTSAGGSSH